MSRRMRQRVRKMWGEEDRWAEKRGNKLEQGSSTRRIAQDETS